MQKNNTRKSIGSAFDTALTHLNADAGNLTCENKLAALRIVRWVS